MLIRRNHYIIFGWIVTIGLILIGAFGYLMNLTYITWSRTVNLILLIFFSLFSLLQVLIDYLKERSAANDFYEKEITEIYEHNNSESKMHFFTDTNTNKCVALTLKQNPIEKSVKLWEGGYNAPPITFKVEGNKIIFNFCSYGNYNEYKHGGPLYQVKYYPQDSKVKFNS